MAAPRIQATSSTAVIVHPYAPENMRFTHTLKGKFTHFAGSKSATRTTFGLSANELNQLVTKFSKEFYDSEATYRQTNRSLPIVIADQLAACIKEINSLAIRLDENAIYTEEKAIADELLKTDHIPLIMSKIASASQYQAATRAVNAYDVATYFQMIPGAKKQGQEYLVKQKMMREIAKLRADTHAHRLSLPEVHPEFYACNRLMMALDEKVISVNEQSMPKEYVQFDLLHTFTNRLFKFTCEMNPGLVGQKFIDDIIMVLNTFEKNTVTTQELISKNMYALLEPFMKNLGFGKNTEIELDEDADDILQEVLPLVCYLNSAHNPFARDGIFGKIPKNNFQQTAITAYKNHEMLQTHRESSTYIYNYTPIQDRTEIFNEDQMTKLIFGGKGNAPAPKTGGLLGLFSQFSIGNSVSSLVSESAALRQQLALPTPPQQLLLMPAEAGVELTETKTNTSSPGQR